MSICTIKTAAEYEAGPVLLDLQNLVSSLHERLAAYHGSVSSLWQSHPADARAGLDANQAFAEGLHWLHCAAWRSSQATDEMHAASDAARVHGERDKVMSLEAALSRCAEKLRVAEEALDTALLYANHVSEDAVFHATWAMSLAQLQEHAASVKSAVASQHSEVAGLLPYVLSYAGQA